VKKKRFSVAENWRKMAGSTRLELATSGVTGRRSNQLNYDPANITLSRHRTIGTSRIDIPRETHSSAVTPMNRVPNLHAASRPIRGPDIDKSMPDVAMTR